MATTASSTDVSSLTAVLNLYRTIRSRAPDDAGVRPVASPKSQADVPRYFDEAIGLLGRATNDAYVDHDHIQVDLDAFQFKVDREFQYVHKWFEKVDGRLDQVDGRLTNMECHHKAMKDNIDKQFGQNLAFQRNRLVRVLEAQIERIAEPKVDEMVFALQQLAKHYSVEGYEDWKMMESMDPDATQYHCLNDAVAAHPEQCLRALAVKWGLEYGQLQTLQVRGISAQAPKRKADDSETESRRVRFRSGSEVETEISILSSSSHQAWIQRHTRTSAEATVPINTTLSAVLEEYGHIPGQTNPVEEPGEVRWSDSSYAAQHHRFRASCPQDPPASSDK